MGTQVIASETNQLNKPIPKHVPSLASNESEYDYKLNIEVVITYDYRSYNIFLNYMIPKHFRLVINAEEFEMFLINSYNKGTLGCFILT